MDGDRFGVGWGFRFVFLAQQHIPHVPQDRWIELKPFGGPETDQHSLVPIVPIGIRGKVVGARTLERYDRPAAAGRYKQEQHLGKDGQLGVA